MTSYGYNKQFLSIKEELVEEGVSEITMSQFALVYMGIWPVMNRNEQPVKTSKDTSAGHHLGNNDAFFLKNNL